MACVPHLLVSMCMWDVIFEDSSSTVTSSRVDCGRLCYLNTTCSSFLFNHRTGMCALQTRWIKNLSESETAGIYYYQVYIDECDDDYQFIRSTGMCVKFSTKRKSWDDAKTGCKFEGARLVILDTVERDAAILEILQNDYPEQYFHIGGHEPDKDTDEDSEEDRRFEWIDGTFMKHRNWVRDEPDQDDHCMIIIDDGWHGAICDHEFRYICEKVYDL